MTCGIIEYSFFDDLAGTTTLSPSLTLSEPTEISATKITVANSVPQTFDVFVKAKSQGG